MATLGQGGQSRRVKIAVGVVSVLVLLTAIGGCTWIQNWLNPNHAPVAVITASTTSGEAPLEVSFDASQSYDPDGDQITYKWDFGDGTTGEGEVVQHGFGSAGSYTVQLQVTDGKGKSDTASKVVSVSQPSDEVTKQQTFDAQNGVTYDTGTGLKVSIPPAPTSGTTKLVVAEDPTPQQPPEETGIELLNAYEISLTQESNPQEMAPKEASQDQGAIKITMEVPPEVDPNEVAIIQWTDEGWVMATGVDSTGAISSVGGVLSPDGRSISIEVPKSYLTSTSINPKGLRSWGRKFIVSTSRFFGRVENELDCFPVYPTEELGNPVNKGTYIERKVSLYSPLKTISGGIWFKVNVEDSQNLASPPRWDPPSHYRLERGIQKLIDWLVANHTGC